MARTNEPRNGRSRVGYQGVTTTTVRVIGRPRPAARVPLGAVLSRRGALRPTSASEDTVQHLGLRLPGPAHEQIVSVLLARHPLMDPGVTLYVVVDQHDDAARHGHVHSSESLITCG